MIGCRLGLVALSLSAMPIARASADPTPIVTQVIALPGGPVLVPIRLDANDDPARGVTARDGERTVTGRVARVSIASEVRDAGPATWLPTAPRFSVDPEPGGVTPNATWLVIFDEPAQTLRFGGETVSVRSLEPPAAAAARAGLPADPRTLPDDAIENPFASPVPESWRRDPSLLNELGRLAHHHDTAWRVLLALGGFAPGPVAARDEPAAMTIGVDDGPEISAEQTVLRDQVLARWQHALLRLWLADPGASVDVRRALAGAARLPDVDAGADATRIVPVWTASDTEAAELLAVLERDGISQASIADFAKGWAARNGGAAAWVIDDAGPTIGIVNLTPDPTIASWFGEAGWNLREDVIRLDPRAGIAFRGASAGTRIVGGVQASRVEVGPWIGSRAVLLGGIEAEPPGPVLGPFQEDLTMSAWVEAAAATRPVTKPAAPRTVARLERREPPGRGSPFSSNALWTLVIECAAAPRAEREGDHVDLWFGPRGSARSVVRVHHDGRLTAERGPALDASWTPIPAEPDRWLAIVPLPEGVIDADGRLMLGMTRTEPEGRRSAWPRPMLPWQREPGRISIDTSGWTRIESDR